MSTTYEWTESHTLTKEEETALLYVNNHYSIGFSTKDRDYDGQLETYGFSRKDLESLSSKHLVERNISAEGDHIRFITNASTLKIGKLILEKRIKNQELTKKDVEEMTFMDFDTVPIGGSNPYYKCQDCGVSVPEINGRLFRHNDFCSFRQKKERELGI